MSQAGYVDKSDKNGLIAPNRIAEARKIAGLSQQELADAIGSHWITISKLERGVMKLTTAWMEKIAPALSVHPSDLLRATSAAALAVIGGRINANGSVTVFRETQTENATIWRSHIEVPSSIWMRVDGNYYSPFLHHGDFVQLIPAGRDELAGVDFGDGRMGYLEAAAGKGRIGFLYRGRMPNTWDLFWGGQRVLQDVSPVRFSVVGAVMFLFSEAERPIKSGARRASKK